MSVALRPFPRFRAFDEQGEPLAGGKLYTYQAGTSTALATYTDSTGNVANANPVILDANGEADVWFLPQLYKVRLFSSEDVLQWSTDNFDGSNSAVTGAINELKGADIASAATVNLTTATGNLVHVTGIINITAITLTSGAERTIVFDGALILTHNATTLILPGGQNITTAAGDTAIVRGDGSGNARVIAYVRANAAVPNRAKGADVASATTVNLNNVTGDFVHITGTDAITAITLASGHERTVVFDGALTLTHDGTTLILPGGANITTAAGDRAIFRGDGTGNVRCISYVKADGTAVVAASINAASQSEMEAASDNAKTVTPLGVNWHPGSCKAWIRCNNAGAIAASYNITSITDSATGVALVTIATDFSSANFAIVATCEDTKIICIKSGGGAPSAGAFQLGTYDTAGSASDVSYMFAACFGDQ